MGIVRKGAMKGTDTTAATTSICLDQWEIKRGGVTAGANTLNRSLRKLTKGSRSGIRERSCDTSANTHDVPSEYGGIYKLKPTEVTCRRAGVIAGESKHQSLEAPLSTMNVERDPLTMSTRTNIHIIVYGPCAGLYIPGSRFLQKRKRGTATTIHEHRSFDWCLRKNGKLYEIQSVVSRLGGSNNVSKRGQIIRWHQHPQTSIVCLSDTDKIAFHHWYASEIPLVPALGLRMRPKPTEYIRSDSAQLYAIDSLRWNRHASRARPRNLKQFYENVPTIKTLPLYFSTRGSAHQCCPHKASSAVFSFEAIFLSRNPPRNPIVRAEQRGQ